MATLPLQGIRVLAVEIAWAAPYGTMFLADMGAEVIRVETTQLLLTAGRVSASFWAPPTKEMVARMARGSGLFPNRDPGVRPWNRDGNLFNVHARNKLSMTVDLRRPEGKDIFRRLVEISDVFIENTVPGAMGRLGLSYDVVSQWNPLIIMISSTGMGQTGPWAHFRGSGSQFAALYGHASLIGYPDMASFLVTTAPDPVAGVAIAFATVMALHQRHKTGKGQFIDHAQGESYIPFLGEYFMDYFFNGRVAGCLGNRHPTMVQGCYPCQGDDEWLTISIASDDHWQALCRVMGRPELAQDERFADAVNRRRHHDDVDRIISEWTRRHDPFPLFHALQRGKVPAGPIMHEDHVFADPHVKARGFLAPITHPETGPVVDGKPTPGTHLYPTTAFKISKLPFTVRKPPVCLGEDNEYVYKKLLGVSDEEYARLEAEGHIGMDYIPEIR